MFGKVAACTASYCHPVSASPCTLHSTETPSYSEWTVVKVRYLTFVGDVRMCLHLSMAYGQARPGSTPYGAVQRRPQYFLAPQAQGSADAKNDASN